MKALIWNGCEAELNDSRAEPHLRDDYVLVRTVAVALNPTDAKAVTQGRAAKDGLLGCDFAGVILSIGKAVTKPWQQGDRVFGCVHGANANNHDDGAFAEIIAAKGDTCIKACFKR
jgi:NADPH:quinone reductase-like Zn-dependent oxidoreductase